ncbi:MAG: dienelactone hydrolase family protein [Polyangiaceae bacterium]|nr:dienelactone hydrolase family protein [Polyangiaceae bacterium]
MTDIERYLVEEIALDFRDGHISRREALRRLGLMGLGATAATSLLVTACGGEPANTAAPDATGAAPVETATPTATSSASEATPAVTASAEPPGPPPVLPPSKPTEAITFPGPEKRTLQGAWALADSPKGGVLVIHENKGLNDHTRHVAGRFAAAGYSALAIDLLSEEGGTASLGDPANATAALGKVPPERFVADMRAGLDEIAKRTKKKKLGVVGFCFGGGMTWRMVASKDARVAAAIPFYGALPDGADFTGSKAAVLGIYAELDARVNATRDAAKAALEKAKLVHEIVTFPGADHAFLNDTGKRFNQAAADGAWKKVLEWYGKYLG